ncbi:hypothetical protein AL755_05050 [Arthrobacter sp. ERGS1:01]|uniref:ROK family transcriptional regulator n=1 Tax=Arthrobacter sp. ERGS1:01 TaxID=1704044 RepID=UPI0006B5BE60|nr:ROK family transcriptional regulator [Arthrobacter sp. ERGS1:01]ALE05003.1 hypothetical protein AL755_05050 [Arthrobacter sp. ERGS1:01]
MTRYSVNSPKTLRRLNSRALLAEMVAADAPCSVTALAQRLRLTRPTVEAALADLVEEGWVDGSEPAATPNKSGRRARLFQFKARSAVLLGVDLTPHSVEAVLADAQGAVLATVRHDGLDLAAGPAAEAALHQAVDDVLDRAGAGRTELVAAVVGVPGIVDREGQFTQSAAVPDWVAAGTAQSISGYLNPAVTHFDNDARLAAAAEAAWGVLQDVENGLHLILGRQIGAGLLLDGKVVRGHHGAAGEIGGLGSLGWRAAGEALARHALPVDALVAEAHDGDGAAQAALAEFAANVATGIAALTLAVDPAVVSVGGDMADAGELFLRPLREAVAPLGLFAPDLRISGLGRGAVALGAMAAARSRFRREILALPGH